MSKTALITGASQGIGRAIALKLASDGFNTVINYIGNSENAEAVAEECRALGVESMICSADVSDFNACETMVNAVLEKFETIDVLVNNAGITADSLLMRMEPEKFSKVLTINLNSVFNMSKIVSRIMMKQRSGRIVSLASVVGITGNAGQCNYSASKAGVIAFTKSLAKEIGSRGITVNAVAPGFIRTSMTDVLSESVKKAMLDSISLNRVGEAEDVANVVSFLASDKASYVTGQTIVVDGGMI